MTREGEKIAEPIEGLPESDHPEWTGDGWLRHPRYWGIRRDKSARDVTRAKAVD